MFGLLVKLWEMGRAKKPSAHARSIYLFVLDIKWEINFPLLLSNILNPYIILGSTQKQFKKKILLFGI